MKSPMTKRILTMALCLVMALGVFPFAALAATDTTSPELKGITLSADTVTAPGSIDVIVDATDDLSGISSVTVSFYCEETGRTMICFPRDTYLDSVTGEGTPYPDGKFHATLEIDRFTKAGTFYLSSVNINDKSGNSRYYSRSTTSTDDPTYLPLPDGVKSLRFDVLDSGNADTTAPVLKSVSISPTALTAPGTIDVAVDVTDDISGVADVNLRFFCQETGKTLSCSPRNDYWDKESMQMKTYEDGLYHAQMDVDQYVLAGTFVLNSANIIDKAGNEVYYSRTAAADDPSARTLPQSAKDLKLVVASSEKTDAKGPELKEITLSTDRVEAPDTIEVVVDASDDVSGIASMSLYFYCEQTKKNIICQPSATYWDSTTMQILPYADGKFHGKLVISQQTPDGEFLLNSVNLYDKAGNASYYNRNAIPNNDPSYNSLPYSVKDLKFTVGAPEKNYNIIRLAGANRYETAYAVADELKKVQGVEKFASVIVASGTAFPDALAGSYLASVKNAPILLVKGGNVAEVRQYIQNNLTAGGTVYLLGGVEAIPASMELGLDGFQVKRLGGKDRYETNLRILEEAGAARKDLVVCTGKNFADSLSASSLGLPILLVKDSLSQEQKTFLEGTSGNKYIIGGKNAVSEGVQAEIEAYGAVKRLAGENRYETSVLVAETFFNDPDKMVLAYGKNFPDGLAGGPLAYTIGAPLLLTQEGKEQQAKNWCAAHGITQGYVLGGNAVLPEKTVETVFGKNG